VRNLNKDGHFTVKGTVRTERFTVVRTVIYGGFHRDGDRLVGGLGAEAELDEGAGVGGDFGLPAVVALELLHGGDTVRVPGAGGLSGEVTLLDEGGLDCSGAFGVHGNDWVVVGYALGFVG